MPTGTLKTARDYQIRIAFQDICAESNVEAATTYSEGARVSINT
jgi:hypothetical protein